MQKDQGVFDFGGGFLLVDVFKYSGLSKLSIFRECKGENFDVFIIIGKQIILFL